LLLFFFIFFLLLVVALVSVTDYGSGLDVLVTSVVGIAY